MHQKWDGIYTFFMICIKIAEYVLIPFYKIKKKTNFKLVIIIFYSDEK